MAGIFGLRLWRATILGSAFTSAIAVVSPAAATISYFYENPSLYSWNIWGMPDFDQVRSAGGGSFGLPNDGLMYCVPTATLNIMAYIANHGFPEVMDTGPQPWQSSSIYNAVGLNLLGMGNLMQTDPFDGTGGFDWRDGAIDYLNARTGAFTVNFFYANGNYAPTQSRLTHTAVCGSLITFAYGRYTEIGTFGEIPLVDRGGGHAVTLQQSAEGVPSGRRLLVRDPADEQDDLFTQSLFGGRSYEQINERFVATAPTFGAVKVMTEIGVEAGAPGSSNRFIDGYLAIRPKVGYALTDQSTLVTLIQGLTFSGFPDPPRTTFLPGGVIEDVMISPDMNYFYTVATDDAGASSLSMLDAATGVATLLNETLGLDDPERLVFGRNRALYLLDQRRLKCIDVDATPFEIEADVVPPTPLVALAYDDDRDHLVGVSASSDALVEYDAALRGATTHPLPDGVDLRPDASIAFNPAEGTLLVHPGGGATVLYEATPLARGESYSFASINLAGVVDPGHVEVDDSGVFYVVGEGGAQAFARDKNGRFGPTEDALFAGVMSDGVFRVTHSRRNDGEYPEEEYFNILPSQLEEGGFVPDCVFDLNGDGRVDAADLARMIAGWGVVGAFGDVAGDGVGAEDLAALIAAWGVCP